MEHAKDCRCGGTGWMEGVVGGGAVRCRYGPHGAAPGHSSAHLEAAVRRFSDAIWSHGEDPDSHTDVINTLYTELPVLELALRDKPDPRRKEVKSISLRIWNEWAAQTRRPEVFAAVGSVAWTRIIQNHEFGLDFTPTTKEQAVKGHGGRIGQADVLLPWIAGLEIEPLDVIMMGFDVGHQCVPDAYQFQEILARARREGTVLVRTLRV